MMSDREYADYLIATCERIIQHNKDEEATVRMRNYWADKKKKWRSIEGAIWDMTDEEKLQNQIDEHRIDND